MAANQEQFSQILTTLLSTDNTIRSQAEEAYSNIPVENRVSYLLSSLENVTLDEDARQMSAVLLRRLFANDFMEFYTNLSEEQQEQFKNHVLNAIRVEQTILMRRKVCDMASEVARNLIDEEGNNKWPEFLQFLFQCANDRNPVMREAALQMFASVPGIFGNQQNNYLDLIKQMLRQSLNPTEPFEVRFQAVKAIGAFIMTNDKETQILKHFADLLHPTLAIIDESFSQQDNDTLLKLLIDLAENVPNYLRPQVLIIFEMCMKLLADQSTLDSWKQLALEVMITLSEMASAMVRKNAGKYVEQLVPLVLQMMADLEDDETWGEQDEVIDEDHDCNNVAAESALDRLACGLGGKTILPLVIQNVPQMLAHHDWKQRYAALMALSAIGEGCNKQMESMLNEIIKGVPGVIEGIIRYLQDVHPRVRYAACNAIGQMSTDFPTVFQKKFHEYVIPTLLMLMDDVQNPRVQAHAGAALVNFFENCPKHILAGYLNTIMSKLHEVLNIQIKQLIHNGKKLVLEQVVTTIASVADTAEKEFIIYYEKFMPILKLIIENSNKEQLKLLRGKTIECVSLIGLAVGSDMFLKDSSEIMDQLLLTHGEGKEISDDDPQTSYLISAWSRICKVMGKRFEQYLPLVMGPVLRTASMKPEVALLDNEDMRGVEGDVDWQFVSLGEQQNFGIRTAGLEDKAGACMMLACYARELKDGFAEYSEEVVKLMVPMLKFYFHDGVRTAAAESLPYLLQSGLAKGTPFVQDMWAYICPELLKALDTEPENDVLYELLGSLAGCIETLGADCLNQESMTEMLKILNKLLEEHFERAHDRTKKHLDEDYDEIVQEQLENEESDDTYVLSKIADVVHALFITYRESFLPFFDNICLHFANLLTPQRPWTDHQWAICVFDDLIEFTGPACAKYQGYFLNPLIVYIKDKVPEVRQAAAYGWGVLAQFGGDQFAGELAKVVPHLVELISSSDSRDPRNICPTENAISALTKIMKYNSSAINLNELLPLWFSWLPVVEDADEAPHVYGYLCDLIEQNNAIILGPGNGNIPQIVCIFAEAFFREALDPSNQDCLRILAIIRQIQSNATVFQGIVSALRPELQQALHLALNTATC